MAEDIRPLGREEIFIDRSINAQFGRGMVRRIAPVDFNPENDLALLVVDDLPRFRHAYDSLRYGKPVPGIREVAFWPETDVDPDLLPSLGLKFISPDEITDPGNRQEMESEIDRFRKIQSG